MPRKIESLQEEIFAEAYKDFENGLKLHASFKVNNRALGEDLVQDTFLKTWDFLVKGGEITKMKAFLYHVLNNLIIDEYRKKKSSSLDDLLEKGFEPSDDQENFFNKIDGAKAMILIHKLPKGYQKTMTLRFVEELSIKEIAKLIGKSSNSVAVQIHRGLEKLKKLYIN